MHDTVCTKRGLSYTIKRYTSCKIDSLCLCIKRKTPYRKELVSRDGLSLKLKRESQVIQIIAS